MGLSSISACLAPFLFYRHFQLGENLEWEWPDSNKAYESLGFTDFESQPKAHCQLSTISFWILKVSFFKIYCLIFEKIVKKIWYVGNYSGFPQIACPKIACFEIFLQMPQNIGFKNGQNIF